MVDWLTNARIVPATSSPVKRRADGGQRHLLTLSRNLSSIRGVVRGEPSAVAIGRSRLQITSLLAVGFLIVAAALPIAARAQEVPELQITSTNYILVDADTGEILAQRGAHERRAIGSITKMFTAIEAIELASPDLVITTSESDMVSEFASQVGFGPGETFTAQDLLYGMMLPSGNDAARALARGAAAQPGDGDQQALQRFLDLINQRIQNMGLADTHLMDPDGWGVPGHYSSAYDLAAFMRYALRYPRFVQAFSTLDYDTPDGQYHFRNNDRMLRTYPGIIGGKTGYDDDAGWCLINVAQRDGHRMIAVTLNGVAPDDWYDDNRVLLDYGFQEIARRQQNGIGVIGEIVRYRDPDAAKILAMGSAGGLVGKPLLAPAPAEPAPAPTEEASTGPPPVALVPVVAASGASAAGLFGAVAIALALIALHGLSAWRFRSPHDEVLAGARQVTPAPLRSPLASLPEPAAAGSD
jgi:D-alanyl-D-alanine carboxypeptidase (penicillin-binding protein 5/6)